MNSEYKKYTTSAKSGIKGEAFFETLLCDFALPHSVVGPKDLGVDYFCEWAHQDRPTGVLFAAQVKTCSEASVRRLGTERLNGLEKYEIKGASHLRIDNRTAAYWRALAIPVYVFVVMLETPDTGGIEPRCYYRRTGQALTKGESLEGVGTYFRVNDGATFLAFGLDHRREEGFARDLFIDHVRWCYAKGTITHLDPGSLGLKHFPQATFFSDLFEEYRASIVNSYRAAEEILTRIGAV